MSLARSLAGVLLLKREKKSILESRVGWRICQQQRRSNDALQALPARPPVAVPKRCNIGAGKAFWSQTAH